MRMQQGIRKEKELNNMALRTKTTTANRSHPEETNTPVYGQTIASKAVQQRMNDDKVQRPKATRNTKLYPTTITAPENADTECYADMGSSRYSDRAPPAEFETTLDGNALRVDCGGIPTWDAMKIDYNDASDIATTKFVDVEGNVGVGTGYRKTPKKMEYTAADNMNCSQAHLPGFEGELQPIKFPGNRAGSPMTQRVA